MNIEKIILDELEENAKYGEDEYGRETDVIAIKYFDEVAKSISAKIEDEFTSSEDVPEIKTLDRKKVKEIIVDIDNEEDFDYAVDKICELAIPTQVADSIGKQIEAGALAGDIEDLVLSQKEVVDNLEVMIYERDKKIKELEIENDKLKTELEK